MQNKLLGVETNASNWQRKQNAANNFSAVLLYDMELQWTETRDQRMMFGLVTMVHLADTKEQLDSDTERKNPFSTAAPMMCTGNTWQITMRGEHPR